MTSLSRLCLLCPLMFAAACADDRPQMTLLATADFHGALDEAERFAAVLGTLRTQAESPVFHIDAGDLYSGTMISNFNEGHPVTLLYNRVAVDAAAVGNHEFDYGPVGENAIAVTAAEDPRGAIRARAAESAFSFLAANLSEDNPDGLPWFRPSVMIERKGVRVGVVGATSMSTPTTTLSHNLKGLTFSDTAGRVTDEAELLRKQGADFVVLTVHDGGICENTSPIDYPLDNGALADLCRETEIFELVDRVPAGTFDAIVAGHTHQTVLGLYRGVPIVQPPAKGKAIARVTLERTSAGVRAQVHELALVDDAPDADPFEIRSLLAPFRRAVAQKSGEPLGMAVDAEFTRDFHHENALGNFMADQLRTATGTDVAIINNGGLRTNLPKGPLTYGKVYDVVPFDNRIAIVTVSGQELAAAVALGVSGRFEGYSWSNVTAVVEAGDVTQLTVGGAPADPNQPFTVTISDFLAGGGSGFAELAWPEARIFFDRQPMRELIVSAIKRASPSTPAVKPETYFDVGQPRLTIR